MRKLLQQLIGGLALEPLHQPADRHLRRNGYEQMHVIFGNMALDDQHILLRANLTQQVADARADLSADSRAPIFRYPDQVQVDLEHRMRAVAVRFTHDPRVPHATARLLKPSPKGEGFDPPSRDNNVCNRMRVVLPSSLRVPPLILRATASGRIARSARLVVASTAPCRTNAN